ncbi:MHFG family PEP-CTERM protein, partial [Janthinobacterium sp. UMAB-60]|uniref:MHFG family PEP-CTERM protein n=1 Tax=Janthinobacterium sp. UMAB-60 TaxID=1365365 RepID=UPI001C57EB10
MRHHSWIAAVSMLGTACLLGMLSLAPLPAYAKGAPRADVLEHCSWNRPGADPFMGDVVAAVDRYPDIAPQVREELKARMRARQYDEIVVISRDAIRGKGNYDARISDMHFGPGRVCRNVTRSGWSEQMQERGLVYCVQSVCILVPTVCRNVSRITRAAAGPR